MAKLTGVKTIDMVGGEITKVEYNGELYAKVDERVSNGDIVLSPGIIDAKEGNFYVVNTKDSYGDIAILDDIGEKRSALGVFKTFRKVSTQSPSQSPSLESRVETLETKVAALEGNEVGDGEYRKVTGRRPRVGDFVKYDKNPYTFGELTVGEYYEIKEIDYYDDPQIVDDDGELYDISGDEFEVYEKVGAENGTQLKDEITALRVGDYAKFIKEDTGTDGVKVGEIVKLTGEGVAFDFEFERVYDGHKSLTDANYLTKATDEEVAEAKAKARWAAIGRKPNEFKEGDIVCILKDNANGSNHKSGDIGVVDSKSNIEFRVRTPRINSVNFVRPQDVELITPVESRFDR